MKTLTVLAFLLFLFTACNSQESYTSDVSHENEASVTYEANLVVATVKGMSCQNCVAAVEAVIAKHTEVENVRVTLENETARVTFKNDVNADMESIAASVKEAGYEFTWVFESES